MEERTNPRSLIVDILLEAEREDKFLDRAVRSALSRCPDLPRRDAAFVRRVCMGTTERRIELDYILDQFSDTKVIKMKPVIRCILRSGVYQLFYMDAVPDSAVCSEAVGLARQRGFSGLSGFVNGVLRNIARNRDRIAYPSMEDDPVHALSVRYSMPEWITERFFRDYGCERCELILAAYLKDRPLCVRVDTRDHSPEDVAASLAAQGIHSARDRHFSGALWIDGFETLEDIPEFCDGILYPQDPASMMAVELADPQKGDRVLDVCAAPGGKSIQAAQIMDGNGEVTARDLSEYGVGRIRENIRRCRVSNVSAEIWDALVFDPSWEKAADIVLADLPCSGLGVAGRKPDIKYRVSEEDVRNLAALQRQILETVARYVRPGGTLLYSTCTVTEEENRQNMCWIAERFPEFSLMAERQLLPDEGCDGFYMAKFERMKQFDEK